MLLEEGYNVTGVYRNGNVFIADVVSRRGRDRLIVDGQSGRVVQAYRNGGAYAEEPAYERRRTARIVPPGDIQDRNLPGFEAVPGPKPYVAPRASAPVQRVKPAKPREQAVAVPRAPRIPAAEPAPVKPAALEPAKPPSAAAPAFEVKPAVPSTPPAAAVAPRAEPAPVTDIGPVARPVQRSQSRVNDIPVAPLDDAAPKRAPRTPVNDVPVAPLE